MSVEKVIKILFSFNLLKLDLGDIGKEMYIIKRGRLSVVSDDGTKVFVTLEEGSVFGEISILNIAGLIWVQKCFEIILFLGSKTGNRRTANIRSVGYSDLFCLTKQDLWEVLAEYPSACDTLIERGKAHLRKDNLLDEDQAQTAQQDQAAIPDKIQRLQGNIIRLESRFARIMGEYRANMNALGQRLQTVEELAEKEMNITDRVHSRKSIVNVISIDTSKEDVWSLYICVYMFFLFVQHSKSIYM
jgi:cyclic nucleotide gated channel alpha 3